MAKRTKLQEVFSVTVKRPAQKPAPQQFSWMKPGVRCWHAAGGSWAYPKEAILGSAPWSCLDGKVRVKCTYPPDNVPYNMDVSLLYSTKSAALEKVLGEIHGRVQRLLETADKIAAELKEDSDG
jgi:hypothetical protein